MSALRLAVLLGCLLVGAADAASLRHITAITIAGQRIDRTHTARLGAWRISFGAARPSASYADSGTALNGLRCARSGRRPAACSLFMVMARFESRASACRIRQAGWDEKIACPQEIHFAP